MTKALPLMVQGTSSDAGKSVLVTALCRIFAQDGYRTAPFKSQNMALNSYITIDGKEMGRAQGVQAEAAGIVATTDMNPILIKPSRDYVSQIVVHGEPYQNMEAGAYRSTFFSKGLQLITESYQRLEQMYERIVIEGAGSPAEINLNDRELVNMRVARIANAPVVLVADIEKGGVFASLVGTLQLLDPQDRQRVIGVIINKFRGDPALLDSGLKWFEEYTGKPVLGVIPYIHHLHIDAEDSLILDSYKASGHQDKEIDIAVIRYPKISNFTDIDPFAVEPDCQVRFVSQAHELGEPDIVILPGSKNTIEDLMFLKESGLERVITSLYRSKKSFIFGICGGYQMLGETVEDPFQVESPHKQVQGLSVIPLRTILSKKKTTLRSKGMITWHDQQIPVTGYEIHMGESTFGGLQKGLIHMDGRLEGTKTDDNYIMGTYFHGIFHNDSFRKALVNSIRQKKGLPSIEERVSYNELREEGFERIAEHVRKYVDLKYIHKKMGEFQNFCKGESH